jgi:hypothetical protein
MLSNFVLEGVFAVSTKKEATMVRKLQFTITFAAALLLALTALGSFRQDTASAKSDQPQGTTLLSYSVKFVCGRSVSPTPAQAITRPGIYATEVNIHNYHPQLDAPIKKEVIPLVIGPQVLGREPNFSGVKANDGIVLSPSTATMDDCNRIWTLLSLPPGTYFIGFLHLITPVDLSVDAVYTSQAPGQANTDIEIERIDPKRYP